MGDEPRTDDSWEEEWEETEESEDGSDDEYVDAASTSTADLVFCHVGHVPSAIQVEVVTSFGLVRFALPTAVVPAQVAVTAVAPFVLTVCGPSLEEDMALMRARCQPVHDLHHDLVECFGNRAKLIDAVLERRSAERAPKVRVTETSGGATATDETIDASIEAIDALSAKIDLLTRRSTTCGATITKQLRAWRQSASCVQAELENARDLTVPLALGHSAAAKLASKILELPVCAHRLTPESRAVDADVTGAIRVVTSCLASCVASDVKEKDRGSVDVASQAWSIPAASDGCREVDKKGRPVKAKRRVRNVESSAFSVVVNATARIDLTDHLAAVGSVSVRSEPVDFIPQGSTSVSRGAHTVLSMNVDTTEYKDEARAESATPAVLRALLGPSHPLCTALTDVGLSALCIALLEQLHCDLGSAIADARPRMLGLSKKTMARTRVIKAVAAAAAEADEDVASVAVSNDGSRNDEEGDAPEEEEDEAEEEEEEEEGTVIDTDGMVSVALTTHAILRTYVPEQVVPVAAVPVVALFITANLHTSIEADHAMLRNMALFTTPKVFHEQQKRRTNIVTWDNAAAANAIVRMWKNINLWILFAFAQSAVYELLAAGTSIQRYAFKTKELLLGQNESDFALAGDHAHFIADHQSKQSRSSETMREVVGAALATLSITNTRDFESILSERNDVAAVYTPAASDGVPIAKSIVEGATDDENDVLRSGPRVVALNVCVSLNERPWRTDATVTVSLATPLASEMTQLQWREPMFHRRGELIADVDTDDILNQRCFKVGALRSALGASHPLCTTFTDYGLAEVLISIAKTVVLNPDPNACDFHNLTVKLVQALATD